MYVRDTLFTITLSMMAGKGIIYNIINHIGEVSSNYSLLSLGIFKFVLI